MSIYEKKRRQRRTTIDLQEEIRKGNVMAFYKSTDWKNIREQRLRTDKYICQFFSGKWNDGKHFPDRIKIIDANTVHHIIPIKERPDLALDIDNMISLSFEAHEIIEERNRWTWRKKKKPLTEERW